MENKKQKIDRDFTMIPNAVDDDGLSPYGARLYWALMRYTNYERDKEYKAFPEYITLVEKCKMSPDKVTDAINELVQAGWIRDITSGKNNRNEYTLNIEKNVNRDLVKRRAENRKRNRQKTLVANARKDIRLRENKIDGDSGSGPQRIPELTDEVTLPDPLPVAAEEGYNNTNITKLNISPISDETGEKFTDYPDTLWLLNIIWKENLLNTTPPSSEGELNLYKKWHSQLKRIQKLGTSEEIIKALKRGVFYNDYQVNEPAQLYNALERKIREIRKEKTDDEEYSRNFLPPPLEYKKEEYVPMPDYVKSKRRLLIENNSNSDLSDNLDFQPMESHKNVIVSQPIENNTYLDIYEYWMESGLDNVSEIQKIEVELREQIKSGKPLDENPLIHKCLKLLDIQKKCEMMKIELEKNKQTTSTDEWFRKSTKIFEEKDNIYILEIEIKKEYENELNLEEKSILEKCLEVFQRKKEISYQYDKKHTKL